MPSGQPIKKNYSPLFAPCIIMRGRWVIWPIDEGFEIKGIVDREVHVHLCRRTPFGLQVRGPDELAIGNDPSLDEAENADGKLLANENR